MRAETLDPMDTGGVDIESLYARERHALTRFAYLLCHDLASAEDLVQDAFVALSRRAGSLADPGRAAAYLRVCVLNASRTDHRRTLARRRRHLRVVDRDAPGPDEGFVLAEEHARVARHVQALPDRQRQVVALRYWADLSEAEIADALGISRGTVKSSASRALATIADALAQEET